MTDRSNLRQQLKLAINSRKISRMPKSFKEQQIVKLRENVEKIMKQVGEHE